MAIITLEQLQTPVTKAAAYATCIEVLKSLGFNTAAVSWQPGGLMRTIVELVAELYFRLSNIAVAISKAAFNETSSAGFLTRFSASAYDNHRFAATSTVGNVILSCEVGEGPHTITPNAFIVADGETDSAHRFTALTGGALTSGGTLTISVQAEAPGADYNIGNNTIGTVVTTLAGVTVSNPPDVSGSWITSAGTDEESDVDLRARNASKWPTLSYATPGKGYEFMARSADAAVTRVYVDDANPGGPGTVYIYVAGASGTVGSGVVAAVQAYIDVRKPHTSLPTAYAATQVSLPIVGTVTHDPLLDAVALRAEVEAAISAYFNSLDIGGTRIGSARYVVWSEILDAVMGVSGVIRFSLIGPAADYALNPDEIVVLGSTTGLAFTANL